MATMAEKVENSLHGDVMLENGVESTLDIVDDVLS